MRTVSLNIIQNCCFARSVLHPKLPQVMVQMLIDEATILPPAEWPVAGVGCENKSVRLAYKRIQ